MRQSRRMSLIEAGINIAAGLVVSWALTYFALPALYGFTPSVREAAEVTGLFTLASFFRAYAVRRIFNRVR